MATVRTDVCRAAAISTFDNPSSKATATVRSAALSAWGSVDDGNGKLKTATSSPPILMRIARRPKGIDIERGLETADAENYSGAATTGIDTTDLHRPVFDCPLQGCFNGCTDFHYN
ncbi:MAG: hypothetical protein ACLP1X_24895 [Polyangiaceae bacterium]